MTHVVLLRGINVNGTRMAMADVRASLEAAGFTGVRTILASGNVLLDAGDAAADEVKTRCEAALRERFGYEAWVIVVAPEAVAEIVDAFPFEERDDRQPYVLFTSDSAAAGALLDGPVGDDERVAPGPHGVVYWDVAKGATIESPFGRFTGKRRFKATTTNRNLRTVRKLLG